MINTQNKAQLEILDLSIECFKSLLTNEVKIMNGIYYNGPLKTSKKFMNEKSLKLQGMLRGYNNSRVILNSFSDVKFESPKFNSGSSDYYKYFDGNYRINNQIFTQWDEYYSVMEVKFNS